MKAQYLGHVVFYVKDLERSLAFYRDLLGFKEVGRIFNGAAAALTSGRTHHELLLIQVGEAPGPGPGRRRGLYHIGIKVGDHLDDLIVAEETMHEARRDSAPKPGVDVGVHALCGAAAVFAFAIRVTTARLGAIPGRRATARQR